MGELGGVRSKLLLELAPGRSVLFASLARLIAAECLDGIIVATQRELFPPTEAIFAQLRESLRARVDGARPFPALEVVSGGDTRQHSVLNALRQLEGRADGVLVHDGARPFCPVEVIRAVAEAVTKSGAAIAAVPAKNSLKRGTDSGVIEATIPRAGVWEAQTPQGFGYELLRRAYDAAEREGYSATDDSELVERLGISVQLISGDEGNLKITTEQDLLVARLRAEKEPF